MLRVLLASWPLFAGLLLVQLGNALQGTLLSLRAVLIDMPVDVYGFVSSGYFAGFLIGSWAVPRLVKNVGHVRVFAALASLVSAAFVLYTLNSAPAFWFGLRLLVGFCISGVYIIAESWVNDAADNENRGTALSVYYLVMMCGVTAGQLLLNLGDPGGFELFVLISVLVSISFTPILLTVSRVPVYETAARMTLRELHQLSPLGFAGQLCLGALYGALFGMGGLYGASIGLSFFEVSMFLTIMFFGAVVFQGPIGWLSDRMERRLLIVIVAGLCAAAAVITAFVWSFPLGRIGGVGDVVGEGDGAFVVQALYPLAFLIGGLANPLYPLLVAHTNDVLPNDRMTAASGNIVFLNGVGAMVGPVLVGYSMESLGNNGFWFVIAAATLMLAAYSLYRSTVRPAVAADETAPFASLSPRAGVIAAEIAQEVVLEQIEAAAEEQDEAREAQERLEAELDAANETRNSHDQQS